MDAIALQRKMFGFSEPDALEIIYEAVEEQAGLDWRPFAHWQNAMTGCCWKNETYGVKRPE